jgi:NSS family neurotransmitter:Na+ symporter
MDTVVALLAGLTIFPIVFATGLEPASGVGLIFQTLPVAFGQMPGGMFFGMLFFILLVFTAWTSAISLLEPIVAWLVESLSMQRVRAAILAGAASWLLGIVMLLSFNHWAFEFEFLGQKKINGMFDVFDLLTSTVLLPLGGLAMAIFVGWILSKVVVMDELGQGLSFYFWYFLIRFIAPFAVLLIFLNAIGVF